MTIRITTKNKDFNQLGYSDIGVVDPGIYVIIYDMDPWENGNQTFAGICTEMAWGDGRNDPLNTTFLVLEGTHKLSEQKEWLPVNLLGREKLETKFDVNQIPYGFTNYDDGLNNSNDLNEKSKNMDVDDLEKLLIFSPKDPTLSLDKVMKLWLSTE